MPKATVQTSRRTLTHGKHAFPNRPIIQFRPTRIRQGRCQVAGFDTATLRRRDPVAATAAISWIGLVAVVAVVVVGGSGGVAVVWSCVVVSRCYVRCYFCCRGFSLLSVSMSACSLKPRTESCSASGVLGTEIAEPSTQQDRVTSSGLLRQTLLDPRKHTETQSLSSR